MKLSWLLTAAAIYMFAIGICLMGFPLQFGIGAVPPDASPELLALMRLLGGPFLGIAALDWLSRNEGASRARTYILIANAIGFGAVAANDIWGVTSGEARDAAKVFLLVHLGFAAAFIVAGWKARV